MTTEGGARRRVDERGDTLVEVLVALLILAVLVVALVGGALTTALVTDDDHIRTEAETILRDYAEAIQATGYTPCAGPSTFEGLLAAEAHEGFTAPEVVSVRYWDDDGASNPTTVSFDPPPCDPGTDDDGVQEVRLRMTEILPAGAEMESPVVEELVTYKRRPCSSGGPAC